MFNDSLRLMKTGWIIRESRRQPSPSPYVIDICPDENVKREGFDDLSGMLPEWKGPPEFFASESSARDVLREFVELYIESKPELGWDFFNSLNEWNADDRPSVEWRGPGLYTQDNFPLYWINGDSFTDGDTLHYQVMEVCFDPLPRQPEKGVLSPVPMPSNRRTAFCRRLTLWNFLDICNGMIHLPTYDLEDRAWRDGFALQRNIIANGETPPPERFDVIGICTDQMAYEFIPLNSYDEHIQMELQGDVSFHDRGGLAWPLHILETSYHGEQVDEMWEEALEQETIAIDDADKWITRSERLHVLLTEGLV